MKMTSSFLVIVAIALSAPAIAQQRDASPSTMNTPAVWRTFAEGLPIGSIVIVRTTARERFAAVLMDVDTNGITVKPKTRVVVPARHVPFEAIESLDAKTGGVNFGKYIGIGAAIGASVFFMLLTGA
jgi:hypothetical protein